MKKKTMLLEDEDLIQIAGGFDDMDFEDYDDDDSRQEGGATGGW